MNLPSWLKFNRSNPVPVAPLDPNATLAGPAVEQVLTESGLTTGAAAMVRAAATAAAQEEVTRALSVSPLGAPPAGQQTSYPLYAYDNPITFSTPQSPLRHPDALVDVRTLRRLADSYDVLRSCIQHLKREVAAVPVQVVFKEAAGDRKFAPTAAQQQRLEQARHFLLDKAGGLGGHGRRRSHFVSEVIEDVCVVGAAAVFHTETRGGGIFESIAIDAATIRPYVDAFGWSDDDKAYEQWIQGMCARSFSRAELTYDGVYPVSYSPYFRSPIEYILGPINAALRADEWNTAWLTDGNTPSDVFAMPDNWDLDKIKSMYAIWEAQSADNKHKSRAQNRSGKARFLPGGSQRVGSPSRKDSDFQQFELWLMHRTCGVMGVAPAAIGHAGEQYKVSQEGSHKQTTQFGAGVLMDFLKATYDDILERAGYDDLETVEVSQEEEDKRVLAERNEILIRSGQKSINEVRQLEGDDPVEGGDAILVPSTLTTLEALGAPPAPVVTDPTAAAGNSHDPNANNAVNPDNLPGSGAGANSGADKQDTTRAAAVSLAQWERKALKRLKDKDTASCGFASPFIPQGISSRIQEALVRCDEPGEVKTVFRAAQGWTEVLREIKDLAPGAKPQLARNLLSLLQNAQTTRLQSIFNGVHSGERKATNAHEPLYDTFADVHAHAAQLGSRLAGSELSGMGEYAASIGQRVADEQLQYAEKFLQDIEAGRYTNADGTLNEDAINQRAALYEDRIRGTANEAWANDTDGGIYWRLGGSNHCGTCEDFAARSPFTPNDMPTYPGCGDTECSIGCDCYLENEGGQRGF